jgi:hypothetical protein
MESTIKQLAAIYNKSDATSIKFRILQLADTSCNSHTECGICYERITSKTKVVCAEPCNKVFHSFCLDKMIDQIENNNEDLRDSDFRCCYCRREFDIHQYDLDILIEELKNMKKLGYHIGDSIQLATINSFLWRNTHEDDEDAVIYYNIYKPTHRRIHKQFERAHFKHKQRFPKNNIMMRQHRMLR